MFTKGHKLSTGRPKGAKSKVTNDIRAIFHRTYETMGKDKFNPDGSKMTGEDAFLAWAQDNETEFYRLYGKMIPTTQEMLDDSHEDFVDDLVFHEEQVKIVEGQAFEVDLDKVGNDDHKQLSSGEDITLSAPIEDKATDTDLDLV